MYLESAIALVFDIAIFRVKFTTLQAVGLAVVIASFLFIICEAYLAKEDDSEGKEGGHDEDGV